MVPERIASLLNEMTSEDDKPLTRADMPELVKAVVDAMNEASVSGSSIKLCY